MRIEIRIFDDNEQVVAEYKGDPCQPGQYRAQVGKTIIGKMPQQSDNPNTGTYELFGFVYQPQLKVDRPNGYTAPVPGPNNGQISSGPFAGLPNYFQSKQAAPKSPWGPFSPTAVPTPAQGGSPATNLTLRG